MKTLLALLLITAFSGVASAAISDATAIQAIERNAVVKGVYAAFYKDHYRGGHCDGCAVSKPADIAKEEKPTVTLTDCATDPNGSGYEYCTAVLNKEIFTKDLVVHSLEITASVSVNSKLKVERANISNVRLSADLND
jgi:hypothetical protein